jgi:hypothetical protein
MFPFDYISGIFLNLHISVFLLTVCLPAAKTSRSRKHNVNEFAHFANMDTRRDLGSVALVRGFVPQDPVSSGISEESNTKCSNWYLSFFP